jgi:hypothetical protein
MSIRVKIQFHNSDYTDFRRMVAFLWRDFPLHPTEAPLSLSQNEEKKTVLLLLDQEQLTDEQLAYLNASDVAATSIDWYAIEHDLPSPVYRVTSVTSARTALEAALALLEREEYNRLTFQLKLIDTWLKKEEEAHA